MLAPRIGGDLPPHLGAVGRILLAHGVKDIDAFLAQAPFEGLTPQTLVKADELRADVARTREQGFCISDQDVTVGVAALGVPVLGEDGQAVAALSVAGLREQVLQRSPGLVQMLHETSSAITQRLRGADAAKALDEVEAPGAPVA